MLSFCYMAQKKFSPEKKENVDTFLKNKPSSKQFACFTADSADITGEF